MLMTQWKRLDTKQPFQQAGLTRLFFSHVVDENAEATERENNGQMGGGGKQTQAESSCGRGGGVFTWEEVQRHSHRGDQWLVIERKVYDVTDWVKRHPGGIRVISHYAGEDATVTQQHFR